MHHNVVINQLLPRTPGIHKNCILEVLGISATFQTLLIVTGIVKSRQIFAHTHDYKKAYAAQGIFLFLFLATRITVSNCIGGMFVSSRFFEQASHLAIIFACALLFLPVCG